MALALPLLAAVDEVDAAPAVVVFGDGSGAYALVAEPEPGLFALTADDPGILRFAHNGSLSPKDDCHKDNKAGERHWHLMNTQDRGGPCVVIDGRTFHFGSNDICAAERAELVRTKEDFWSGADDFRTVAESLKDCIIGLGPPD